MKQSQTSLRSRIWCRRSPKTPTPPPCLRICRSSAAVAIFSRRGFACMSSNFLLQAMTRARESAVRWGDGAVGAGGGVVRRTWVAAGRGKARACGQCSRMSERACQSVSTHVGIGARCAHRAQSILIAILAMRNCAWQPRKWSYFFETGAPRGLSRAVSFPRHGLMSGDTMSRDRTARAKRLLS